MAKPREGVEVVEAVVVAVGEGAALREAEAEAPRTLAAGVALGRPLRLPEELLDGVAERVCDSVMVPVLTTLPVAAGDQERERDWEGVAEAAALALGERPPLGVRPPVLLSEGEEVTEAEREREREGGAERVAEAVPLPPSVAVGSAVAAAEGLSDGDAEAEGGDEGVPSLEGERCAVARAEAVPLF